MANLFKLIFTEISKKVTPIIGMRFRLNQIGAMQIKPYKSHLADSLIKSRCS